MTQVCVVIFVLVLSIMFKGKILTDYSNLFSPNNFKSNDNIISNYFLNKL